MSKRHLEIPEDLMEEGSQPSPSSASGSPAHFYLFSKSERLAHEDAPTIDAQESDEVSVACRYESDGRWTCQPYNPEGINSEVLWANRSRRNDSGDHHHDVEILNLLREKGVRVFVVNAEVSESVAELMESIHSVIRFVSQKVRPKPCLGGQAHSNGKRCLLYKDHNGKYYNLTLAPWTVAPVNTFRQYLDSFSGIQAMSILVVLSRSFACGANLDIISEQFNPAYVGVILGLVFVEEISFSWINTAVMVRGMPSISAYTVTTHFETDWLRKLLIFCLYLGAATKGQVKIVLTLSGIALACLVLLANLGARAWGFLGWRPVKAVWGGGILDSFLSYLAAIASGIAMPYLGHREMQVGGKMAMNTAIRHALVVALVFILSDQDDVQKFLVIGSENCNQDKVNMAIGCWWAASLIVSLLLIRKIPQPSIYPDKEKLLLVEDHTSPLGFKVPSLSDFPIDPILASRRFQGCSDAFLFVVGLALAVAGGVVIFYLSYTDLSQAVWTQF